MEEKINYKKLAYYDQRHIERFQRHVEKHGVPCQECRGYGGWKEAILDDGSGPFETCGLCEGTGLTTKHIRGLWLGWKKKEKHAKEQARRNT